MGLLKNILSSYKKEKSADTENKTKEKNFDILKFDGLRAARVGKTDYAIRCYREALLLKEDFETMTYLANAYLQKGKLEEAHDLLLKMTELEPTHLESWIGLAQVCYQQENYPEMMAVLEKAQQADANNATLRFLTARAYRGMNNDINAIASLTQAIQLKEDFTEARLMRAEILMKMGCTQDAAEDVNEILKQEPDHEEALLDDGQIKLLLGKEAEAEEVFKKVIQLNPFNEKAYLMTCGIYLKQKDLSKAEAILDEAIEVNPNLADAYRTRGEVKLLKGDKEGSMKDLKMALELNPDSARQLDGEYRNFDDLYKNDPFKQ